MSLFSKQTILISIAILTLSSMATANKCTDALFRVETSLLVNNDGGAQLDSIYKSSNSEKYFYENGKLAHVHYDKQNDDGYQDLYIYYNADETALKKSGREYIITNCSVQDTLCYQQKVYDNGKLHNQTNTTKITSNYVSIVEANPTQAYILKNATLIDREFYGPKSNPQKITETFYIADSKDDTKCYWEASGKQYGPFIYKPNEKGYSIAFTLSEKTAFEIFVTTPKESSIPRIRKPAKIAPKARYFDLLGRYKFTK